MEKARKCRVRGCQNRLATQNKIGFCAKCQQTQAGKIARLDPKWAAKRRAYFAEWRARNQKKYGKTRPSPEERGVKPAAVRKQLKSLVALRTLIAKAEKEIRSAKVA